ncbi:GMP synthase [glutamine-hydrolyzing] [Granulibacter bethesdensis]|nr:GMP synthase [glutamine-hydrolyzing] [Granulibacter bethesdensis]
MSVSEKRMKIGILQTGRPPAHLVAGYGDYPAMLRRLLGDRHDYSIFDVQANQWPQEREADRDACDAYVITGSAAGVHDGQSWIETLGNFLRERAGKSKLVGICFGHQIMAEAFGGRVERARIGWGLGLHRYRLRCQTAWTDPVEDIAIPVSHQDQVVEKPPAARIIASSHFTPFAVVEYPSLGAVSFQCHPEFDPDFAAELVHIRPPEQVDQKQRDQALASLQGPHDNPRLGQWINRFLTS